MSSASQPIPTPTSFTTATTKPKTMAATAFTAVTTIVSTVITFIQSAPTPTPTATTTGHLLEPSTTTSASSDSSESSPAPKPWVSEPYYSGTSFIASVANILYMIFYTVPLGYNQIIGIFLIFQRRREALAKQLEEQKWKEETRHLQIQQTEGINKMVELMGLVLAKQRDDEKEKAEARDHRIQQTEGINKMVELLGSVLQDNKALKEDKKVLCQCVERLESRMQDSEKLINGMERMVTVVQGLEGVFRVALEGVETRIGAIEHMVDWMLDYHLDENKRFHALKVILAGLLK